jgi:hypothetical protein
MRAFTNSDSLLIIAAISLENIHSPAPMQNSGEMLRNFEIPKNFARLSHDIIIAEHRSAEKIPHE